MNTDAPTTFHEFRIQEILEKRLLTTKIARSNQRGPSTNLRIDPNLQLLADWWVT